MKYIEIERLLRQDIIVAHEQLRELAPQDSEYVSDYKGKTVDYIFVDNIKTYSNTNHLYNSIDFKETFHSGRNITAISYVDSNVVPYYEKAVLRPNLLVARQYGKTEYGDYRVDLKYVDEYEKENRNYMYYMRGRSIYRGLMDKWNGREFTVVDSVGDFI